MTSGQVIVGPITYSSPQTPAGAALLRQRAATLLVGNFNGEAIRIQCGPGVDGLDISFQCHRGLHVTQGSLQPQPNTCDLKVWNLNPDHRSALEQATRVTPGAPPKIIPCVLSAGYVGRQSVVFSGQLRAANSCTEGPDVVTELSTGDGDQALAQARLTLALGPGTTARQGLTTILKALGIGDGNLEKAYGLLAAQPLAAQLYSKGGVFKGAAGEIMSDFCRSAGLEWSVQDGKLQLTTLGSPLDVDAVLIDADHGMVGSPTVDTKGILTVKTLMLPDIGPGRKLDLEAAGPKGGYRVIGVETTGDTYGDQWGHSIEAQRY